MSIGGPVEVITNGCLVAQYSNGIHTVPITDTDIIDIVFLDPNSSFTFVLESATNEVGIKAIHLYDVGDMTNLDFTFKDLLAMTTFRCTANLRKIVSVASTWANCRVMESFPSLDLSSVTYFNQTWKECRAIVDFPYIATTSAILFNQTWYNCIGMVSIMGFDTSNTTSFRGTFTLCTHLLSIPWLDLGNVVDLSQAFYGCTALTSIGSYDFSSVKDADAAFQLCSAITEANITLTPTSSENTFNGCTKLECIKGPIDTRGSSNKTGMFLNCAALINPDAAAVVDLESANGALWVNPITC